MKRWQVEFTDTAKKQLITIQDIRIRNAIIKRIDQLNHEPEKQGKPLQDDLKGFRSVRAVGQRYRIIYKVQAEQVLVVVVAIGIRKDGDIKDVYKLIKRLARLNLLD